MTTVEFLRAITDGDMDGCLEQILTAAESRRHALALKAASELKPGDPVVLNGNARPKRIQGLRGTVLGFTPRGRIRVYLKYPVRGFSQEIECPLTIVTKQ